MNLTLLETSQLFQNHPVLMEKSRYKLSYINLLKYFVQKYAAEDSWSNQVIRLYAKKFCGLEEVPVYEKIDLKYETKKVFATKFRPFKFFTYKYCFIIDCIFICAYLDKQKGEKLFSEISGFYKKRDQKDLRQVFEALYNSAIQTEQAEIQPLMECWRKNRSFCEEEPLKVMITANMSAGKSTLLNALIGKKVNKTQNEACTAKIHKIVNKPFEDGLCYELDYLLELDADYKTLMDDNVENQSNEITVGTYFRTVGTSPKRIWFIDTPGVNYSQNVGHKLLTEKTICDSNTDLLIYLLNCSNIGTLDEREHLLFILEHYHGKILFVVNKLDCFRSGEDSVRETLDAVTAELMNIGFKEPNVVPISSYAAYLAKMKLFHENIDEDEQYEYKRLSRKMKKIEYQFEQYYPEEIKETVSLDSEKEEYHLLLHSGLLHLEKLIYNMR